jgi:hypothetical protein
VNAGVRFFLNVRRNITALFTAAAVIGALAAVAYFVECNGSWSSCSFEAVADLAPPETILFVALLGSFLALSTGLIIGVPGVYALSRVGALNRWSFLGVSFAAGAAIVALWMPHMVLSKWPFISGMAGVTAGAIVWPLWRKI